MESLQESIDEHGILNALVVDRLTKDKYRLIDGYNRLGCVPKDAKVPCHIMGEDGCHMIAKKQISTVGAIREVTERTVAQILDSIFGAEEGVLMCQILDKNIPIPTYTLKWGEKVPAHIFKALQQGEAAILLDEGGEPKSIVIIDNAGVIREKSVKKARKENQEKRRKAQGQNTENDHD